MIVVTGAAGFIGSQLALRLASDAPAGGLLLVDHPMRPEKTPNLRGLEQFPWQAHDEFLRQLQSGAIAPRAVFHLGACSDTTETRWDYLAENNLRYSQAVWAGCARLGAPLLYASSAATYGDGSLGFDDTADLAPLRPLNLYGRSKHEFDLWVMEQLRLGAPKPPQWAGLKFFNVFGPGEAHKGRMASMVFHGFNQIRATGQMRLFKSHRPDFTDGGQLRDFIYVKDVVDTMIELMNRPSVSGLFNLGTGRARTFRDLGLALFAALGLPANIEYIPMPGDLQGKYQYFTEAKMDKLAAAGLAPQFTPLEKAVADYAAWMSVQKQAA